MPWKPKYNGFKIRLECNACGVVTEVDTAKSNGLPTYVKEGPTLAVYRGGGCETCAFESPMVECTCGNEEQ